MQGVTNYTKRYAPDKDKRYSGDFDKAQDYRFLSSVNQIPEEIYIHAIGEYLELGEKDRYCVDYLSDIGLMAHAFISTSGLVIRTLRDNEMGAHARGHNKNTLGVEIMVGGCHTIQTLYKRTLDPYVTDVQMNAVIGLVREWRRRWGIPVNKIFRHSDRSQGRKFDPNDGFNFELLLLESRLFPESITEHESKVKGHLADLQKIV